MVCIRCQKRPAIIFIQRMVDGQMKQEGYCLHCARELHIKPVDDLMKQFGMSDQDLDNMENRMESMMEELGDSNPLSMMMNMTQGGEDAPDEDEDLIPGSNATFPLGFTSSEKQDGDKKGSDRKNGKKPPKRKFLDTYCENLTRKAREGKLDDIIGRDREIYRTIQILSRRQKNNPCLIGEAGVGKTAIAEGIAERIAKGDVPIGLQDKEIYLLDLTSLVAGTQFRGQFEQRVKGLLGQAGDLGDVVRMRGSAAPGLPAVSGAALLPAHPAALSGHPAGEPAGRPPDGTHAGTKTGNREAAHRGRRRPGRPCSSAPAGSAGVLQPGAPTVRVPTGAGMAAGTAGNAGTDGARPHGGIAELR